MWAGRESYPNPWIQTRGSEEGSGQSAVSGDLSDVCGDVDESTDNWRNPVEAQQSEIEDEIERHWVKGALQVLRLKIMVTKSL